MSDPSFEAEDTPGLARHRRELLSRLAEQTGQPQLAEMSRELLAGRLTPTEIIGRHLYDEAFAAHGREVASWYESLSTEQREAEAERAREHLDGLARDEVQTPTAGTPWRARRQETDEDEEDLSLRETWRRKPKR